MTIEHRRDRGRGAGRSDSGREAQPGDQGEVDRAQRDAERLERDHHGADDSAAINPDRSQASTGEPGDGG